MKQTYLKSLFLSLLMIVVGINVASAQTRTLWQEDFSSYSANDVPSGGTYNYVCKDGGSTTKIYNEALAGRTAPELLVSKSGGTFMATVPLDNIEGDLTLTFYTNKQTISVNTTTEGIEGSLSVKAEGQHTLTFTGVTADMTEIVIVFTGSGSSNVRLDDILLTYTPPSNRTLSSISLSGTYPTTFKVGDTFSHEGMTVTATYDDNTTEDVTEDASFEGYDMSTAGDQEVTVSYTEGEETKTATYDITVKNIQLTGITLSGDYPTTFDVGDSFSHEGMTVTANYDDNTTEDVTADASFEGYDMSTAGEQEVTVSYTKGEVTKTATYNITVNALTGDAYALVTSVDDLADGDNVIIVNKDAGKAISTTQATNNRPATGVTFDADGNAIVPSSTDIQVFTLEGNTEGWYFNTGSGYIYAASSSNNHLKTETEADDNAKASISISDGDATIQFQGSNTRNLLKYNSGSSIFSCYSSGQQPVQIYSKSVNKKLTSIMLSGEYPTTFFVGAEFSFGETGTVTAVYDDNSTKVVTDKATFTGYDMNTVGTQTVTVSYTERGVTKTQTYDITVNNRALSSITLSGDYPTTFNVGDEFSHEGMTVTATYDNNTSEDVTEDATFEGYDMSTAGTQTVTVSYTKGEVTKTATYDITVNAVAVTGITLDKEALQLKVGKTKQLTATVEPDNATDKTVVWNSDDESVATVDGGLVTAVAEGTATITVATPDGAQSATCAVTVVETTAATEYYEKVTSAPEDWSGEYLIVYEDGSNAFDGSLETLDAVSNYIEVEIDDDKIEATEDVVASAVTIAKIEDESTYSIKSASGYYIGLLSEGNGLKSSTTTVYQNSISFNTDGTVNVISQNCYLRFNTAENQTRYRYMKSNSSNNKLPLVCLYKKVEATSVTTYSLVVGEEETPFEGLSLTKALPANTQFYIKDSNGKAYYAEDGEHNVITADNHENLNTSENDEYKFNFIKANTWVFTITEATDGIKLAVNPETQEGTKYMMAADYSPVRPFEETEDVFVNGRLEKEMTTDPFYIVKSDDYEYYPMGPAETNAEDEIGRPMWEFSGENNTVGFIEAVRSRYRVSEADTYIFTLDLENNTITALPSVKKYTLVTSDGNETVFDNELKITGKELPAQTEFYIKDNYGKTYYAEDGKNIISAENHENMDTYYPVEGNTPVKFYLMKANTWNFTLTEPTDEGATIKLTVNPVTTGETKYMLADACLHTSDFVFDENLQLTKAFTAGEAFYITRSDDYGLFDLTAADQNDPDGYYVWEFSEENNTVGFIPGKSINAYRMKEAGTYTITLYVENRSVYVEKVPATYTLVKNDGTEYPFEGLTLTTDALPAEAHFHIKDNFGNNYYAISTDEEIPYAVAITAENHDDLSTRVSTSDDIEDICRFFLGKQNTWMFTITPAEDGTIKLSVSPQTEGETKYMIADETPYTETENVFTEDGKLTKVMTTASFFIVKSDDYAIVPLVPAESNTEDESRHPVWEFSGENNTVGFSMGNPYALDNYTYPYRMSEADTYNFTLDLENNTVTVEAVPTTYTLVADGGYGWSEWEFDGLLLNEEFPNGTEFYIKDNKGNVYYGEYGNSIIYAENHENLNTYYPVEDETVTEKPEPFELRRNAIWHFTITEPAEDGETIKLTVVPSTIEEIETKYMLSSTYLATSEDVFDENLKITKEFTAGEAFYITREDGFGIFNMTAADKNDPDGYYVWEFSEDAPTVGYIPAKIINAFRMKDAGTYTITLDTENQTVTAEKYVETVDVTITSAEWGTFVTPVAVRFPVDVRAYVIRETRLDKAIGEEITEAPAGTPVIVNGAEGIHNLTKIDDAAAITSNLLLVSDGNVTGDGTIYVLAVEGGQPGFAPLSNGKTLSDGKAYLKVDNASGAKINFVIDDATDIRGIENTVDFSDGDWYNLQGVKVTSPQRGIYIHNGKKVVIK